MGSAGQNGSHNVAKAKGPGVVVGRSGASMGRVHYSESDYWPHNTCLYVTDFQGNNPRFAYYVLGSLDLAGYNSGSAQPSLNRNYIYGMPLKIPSRAQQDSIVEVLSALDDRIALLRETNATLEAIAQALYKSWFVDFDPVHARARGEEPAGLTPEVAALFPDNFEESDLGMIPKGWKVVTVESLCSQITNGGTPSRSKKELWDNGSIPWFKTGEFSDGFLLEPGERITEAAVSGSSVKVLPENAVLMAIYAAPTVGRLGILTHAATFNQACTGMVAKPEIGPWFLFLTLFFGREWFNSRANGAAQQNISKAIVACYSVVRPDEAVLAAFNDTAASLFSKIRAGSEQAQTLATLRDTLQPRLISGQLRLAEAEVALQEAGI